MSRNFESKIVIWANLSSVLLKIHRQSSRARRSHQIQWFFKLHFRVLVGFLRSGGWGGDGAHLHCNENGSFFLSSLLDFCVRFHLKKGIHSKHSHMHPLQTLIFKAMFSLQYFCQVSVQRSSHSWGKTFYFLTALIFIKFTVESDSLLWLSQYSHDYFLSISTYLLNTWSVIGMFLGVLDPMWIKCTSSNGGWRSCQTCTDV